MSRLALRSSCLALASALSLNLTLSLAGAPAWAGPGAHGPNGEHLDAPAQVSGDGLGRLPDGSVNVPMASQRRWGLRTALLRSTEAAATVSLPARVRMDPNAGGRVQSIRGGRIEPGPRGLPTAGQRVRQGEVLAHVRPEADPYATASQQAQLTELRAARQLAAARLARQESLEGTVPRKEIEATRIELQSLGERIQRMGASLTAREALVAPVSGVIARADAVAGQVVEPRDVLFEVVDPARVLVEASTPDPALAARIADASWADQAGGQLQPVGAAHALRDGMLPITFRVEARGAGQALPLAVDQTVTVIARLKDKLKGVVLPAEAVVRNTANEPIVWIKSGAERYIPQPVQVRPLDGQTVVVTQGLGEGNRVVVKGAALIAQIR